MHPAGDAALHIGLDAGAMDVCQTDFDRQHGSSEVLAPLSEKRVPLVSCTPADGIRHHGELRREIPGIARKMLVQALRRLEPNGLGARTLYPHVDDALTPPGQTLGTPFCAICDRATAHHPWIEAAHTASYRQPRLTDER
jgi:DNA-binding HxlR family transcriptional regulator